ncbi:MAG: YtxH domain-containing protein [Thermoleophilia bacterium]|nr:YtxH domain-containing protein [Thermoleophilia bacterium]
MKRDQWLQNIAFFFVGVGVGAAIALLYAPQSGVRTRRQIRRAAEDAQSYLEELGEELIERGRELIERARQTTSESVKQIGQKVREVAG